MALKQEISMNQLFTPGQAKEIIRRIADVLVPIEGNNKRSAAWFTIEELCNGEWRFAGKNPR